MSDQKRMKKGREEQLSVDELIQSAKEELREEPDAGQDPLFQPTIPAEYADLVSDEELALEEEKARYRLPAAVRVLLYVCCVLAVSVLLAVAAWKCADDVCALTAKDKVVTVTVPENATISDITDMLAEKGLIRYKWLFSLYCMMSNAEEKIDPGTYELNAVFDYHALVNGMIATSENRATVRVTIPEGYEAEDIFRLLADSGVCTVEELEEAAANYAFEYDFLQDLTYGDYRRLEGYLFPDTYDFYVGDAPENVLSKFLRNFNNKITEDMYEALDELNVALRAKMEAGGFTEAEIQAGQLTLHDIIIVASLVEKETSRTAESASISSVIYNRLCSKLYPCLNIDATIQYVLPERKDILTNADKAIISPYNTYTNAGLPVGPIANPGINSIRAALYPADSAYFFYAPDLSGTHEFFETASAYQEYLDELSGKNAQMEVTVTEDQAVEIALEEGKKELYQDQRQEGFSENPTAKLLASEEELAAVEIAPEWNVADEEDQPLFQGQPVWQVLLQNESASLVIYVDATNGAVIGAAKGGD